MKKVILIIILTALLVLIYSFAIGSSSSRVIQQPVLGNDQPNEEKGSPTQPPESIGGLAPKQSSSPGGQNVAKQQKYTAKAERDYRKATSAVLAKKYPEAAEALHDAFITDSNLIDRALVDQTFRDFRDSLDFQRLLKIHGRDIYKDLGLPPIKID